MHHQYSVRTWAKQCPFASPAAHQGDHTSHNFHETQDQLMPDMPWIYIQRSTYGPLDQDFYQDDIE